jgi:hypothetical protein
VGHVGVDVEGQAVEADPLFEADAQGGDFARGRAGWIGGLADPNASCAKLAVGGDGEVSQGVDDGLFEQAHVIVEAEVEGVEIEDGVDDELAWAVVGDVAAAVGGFDCDAKTGELVGGGQEVGGGGGSLGDGDGGWVFEEEEDASEGALGGG